MYSAKKGICCAWWGGGGHCLEKRPTRDWMPAPNATPASPTNLDSLPQVERSFLHHHQQQHLPKKQNQKHSHQPRSSVPCKRFPQLWRQLLDSNLIALSLKKGHWHTDVSSYKVVDPLLRFVTCVKDKWAMRFEIKTVDIEKADIL